MKMFLINKFVDGLGCLPDELTAASERSEPAIAIIKKLKRYRILGKAYQIRGEIYDLIQIITKTTPPTVVAKFTLGGPMGPHGAPGTPWGLCLGKHRTYIYLYVVYHELHIK